MAKVIDLSIPLEEGPSDPSPVKVTHEYHKQGAEAMKKTRQSSSGVLPGEKSGDEHRESDQVPSQS